MIGKSLLLSVPLLLSLQPVSAQSLEGDRFSLSLGAFVVDQGTETRLDSSLGAGDGTRLDFEADLGLDSSNTVFRIDGYLRFTERHRFDFSVFDFSRAAVRQIQRDIQWGDNSFALDTVIETDLDLTIYKAAYTYSFIRRDKGYLGATAGLYIADTTASLAQQSVGQAEVGDLTAPLPVIGLRGQYQLADKWSIRASGEFFLMEYNDLDGSLVDLYTGIDYQLLDFMAIGLGVNHVVIDIDADKPRFAGSLNWQYSGGLLFLKFDF